VVSFAPSFFDHYEDWLNLAVHDVNQELRTRRLTGLLREAEDFEMNQRLRDLAEWRENNGRGIISPVEEKRISMSAIERIKAKALQARGIAPKAIADFEADMDALIAEGPKLENERIAAVAPHKDAAAAVRGEFAGLRDAMNIFSNGGPSLDPLEGSEKS